MGRADLRRLFALLPFAIIPFMFIYKEVSFGDVIRRKAAQKAALLFFYSRPPQAGTFSYKSPAAGRLLSALQAPYQSAARAPLFLPCLFLFLSKATVAFDLHAALLYRAFSPFSQKARQHSTFTPLFLPCLFHFLSKGTVVFALHAAFFTVPFPLFAKRHGSVHHSNQSHVKPRYRWAPSLIPRLAAKRRNSPCGVLFHQNNRPSRSFLSKKIAPTHSLFYQINGANALIAILK